MIAALGLAQRLGWIAPAGGGSVPAGAAADASEQIYTCPMHPQIRQPGPGRCPICAMPLVPATSSSATDLDELSVMIEPAQRRLANIETAQVERSPVVSSIETVGAIAIDESRMATIAAYVDGRLERLFADYTGVRVAQGDHLAVVYSPQLYAAQVEFLESRSSLADTSNTLPAVREAQRRLAENSRQRLVELGLQPAQIAELETLGKAESRLTLYAPIGGTVIEKMAMEGKYISAGEPIYRIADLSMVWLMLELYPEDAARVRFGQLVEAETSALPGEVCRGRVAFIDPTVDPQKRTVGVRVEFVNPGGQLRPGDYATATIFMPIGAQGEIYDADLAGRWISPMHPQIIRDEPGPCPICGMDLVPTTRFGYANEPLEQPAVLHVPRSAVLMAGDNSVVYVETEPGRFELRPVDLGPILSEQVVIHSGLEAGESVATSGNFLIDSQMQLAGKPSLIDPSRAVAAHQSRQGPLEISSPGPAAIGGEAGSQLEALFAAYFRIQQTLAADSVPLSTDAEELHRLAADLQSNASLNDFARERLEIIARHSEHLHHLEIDAARHEAFRPLSHAVLELAAAVRGDTAARPFQHMFCPMVKGGEGDWLQDGEELRNPYWGSQMLTCGEVVRELPLPADARTEPLPDDPDSPSPPTPDEVPPSPPERGPTSGASR